jgi:hypothetical protein
MTRDERIDAAVKRMADTLRARLIQHPDYNLQACAYAAALEESIVYGDPRSEDPGGFLGVFLGVRQ